MKTKTENPTPPGGTGLPLIGGTLAYLANGYEFIERRREQFGPVFRTNLLGRPTAVISGPDACDEWIDPDRFSPGRAEQDRHEHAFSPHGPGPSGGHKCPGADYASLFMDVLIIQLLRDFEWDLLPQNLEYDWRLTPPEPKDGLRLRRS